MNSERKKEDVNHMYEYENVEIIKSRLRIIHKEDWNTIELFQWILFFFIPNNFLDDTNFSYESYQYLNGQIIYKLKADDIERLDPENGRLLFTQFMQFNTSDELKNNNPLFRRSSNAIRNLTNQRLIIWLVKSFIPENSIGLSDFNLKAFTRYDGETLIRKSCEELQKIDPKYGKLLYEKLNELNSQCDPIVYHKQTKQPSDGCLKTAEILAKIIEKQNNEKFTNIPSFSNLTITPLSPAPSDDIYIFEKSSDNNSVTSSKSSVDLNDINEKCPTRQNQTISTPTVTSRLRRALEAVDNDSEEEANVHDNHPYNLKKMKNCIHLWQFLRDLLQSEQFNPSVISWIDAKKGVFKVIEPNRVAQMWAYKKGRKAMSYENLSRGLRHSRKNGYFRQVTPMSSYGKKLIYQFGPKSIQHCKWLQAIVENNKY